MSENFKDSGAIKNMIVGILLVAVGIYCIAGYDILHSATFWMIVGIICIIKGISYIS